MPKRLYVVAYASDYNGYKAKKLLENEVRGFLNEGGWEPLGGVSISATPETEGSFEAVHFAQALTTTVPDEEEEG
jgi:hypothetical protein